MAEPPAGPWSTGWTPTGTTRLAGVIGDPIRHSLSPTIVNAAFAATGLDWVYLAFPVAEGRVAAALEGVRALGIDGLSVTMPHKTVVAGLVDELTPEAAALAAVNCVVRDGDRLVGHNTDGGGFLDALVDEVELRPAGARCVVLGAGGAARAVILALAGAEAERVDVVNRTIERAETAAALAGAAGGVVAPDDADDVVAAADLVVNATSVGMATGAATASATMPVDGELLRPGQVVVDLVYQPLVTPLLEVAERRGATAVGGVGMLVHQAARAFHLWTGQSAPVEAMAAAARRRLS